MAVFKMVIRYDVISVCPVTTVLLTRRAQVLISDDWRQIIVSCLARAEQWSAGVTRVEGAGQTCVNISTLRSFSGP